MIISIVSFISSEVLGAEYGTLFSSNAASSVVHLAETIKGKMNIMILADNFMILIISIFVNVELCDDTV